MGYAGFGETTASPGREHREQQMRQRVLGADGDDRFPFGIQFHAIIRAIPAHDLMAQRDNAARSRIPVIARLPRLFDQLLHHRPRRGAVGIPHAEIDDIDLFGARLRAFLVENGENVGRQLLNAIKLFGGIGH